LLLLNYLSLNSLR